MMLFIVTNSSCLIFNAIQTSVCKSKLQVASLKCDVELFSKLHIGCQTRERTLEDFFHHENQAYPAASSDGCQLHLDNKSDLLAYACLIDDSEYQSDALVICNVIIDGAIIVQTLKPAAVKNFDEYASQIF